MGAENANEMGYWQAVTPDALQARTNATRRSINRAMIVLGAPAVGSSLTRSATERCSTQRRQASSSSQPLSRHAGSEPHGSTTQPHPRNDLRTLRFRPRTRRKSRPAPAKTPWIHGEKPSVSANPRRRPRSGSCRVTRSRHRIAVAAVTAAGRGSCVSCARLRRDARVASRCPSRIGSTSAQPASCAAVSSVASAWRLSATSGRLRARRLSPVLGLIPRSRPRRWWTRRRVVLSHWVHRDPPAEDVNHLAGDRQQSCRAGAGVTVSRLSGRAGFLGRGPAPAPHAGTRRSNRRAPAQSCMCFGS